MKRLLALLALIVLVVGVMAVGVPALGPAPSWQLNQGAAGSCVSATGFNLPGVEINVPGAPASESGVLSAPGYSNLGRTQDSSFTGVGTFSFFVFSDAPYSLAAHTALTLSVTTYYGTGLTGGVAYISTLTWDCTSGAVLSRDSGVPGHVIVRKVVPTGAPSASFGFDASFGDFSLAGGGSRDSGGLLPGIYSVAEVGLPAGWSLKSAVCSDGSSPAAIGLALNETVTCTFTNTYPMCFGKAATIVGTVGADTLNGTAGPDVIVGLGGRDTINGLGGNDRICGGPGADQINGGDGNDRIRGQGGADTVLGGAGDDRLRGGGGVDSANGGPGTDGCSAETTTACE